MSKLSRGGVSWPADKVQRRSVDQLSPYARNSRTHSDEQIAQIAASIKEWGFTNPVLINETGEIIAGHGRVLAAQSLGLADIPVMVAEGWSEAQRRAYVIADNKLTLNGGWDEAVLRVELRDLQELDYSTDLTGFSASELEALFKDDFEKEGLTDPDDAPDVQAATISMQGDVWCLGEHRVMCGDSTDADAVKKLCGSVAIDAVWTDPPYNVNYKAKAGKIKNDNMKDAAFAKFLTAAFSSAFQVMRPGAAIYVAHADTEGLNFRASFIEAGFKLSGCLVWVKNALVLGRSDYQWRHEPILYGWKEGAAHSWYGGRAKTTVHEALDTPIKLQEDGSILVQSGDQVFHITGTDLNIEGLQGTIVRAEKPKRSSEHPTMKPVGLIIEQLKNSSKIGDRVLDLFGGSGSTLIACEKTGRTGCLMEFDEKFADVIVRRWQEFTGQQATLDGDGRTFAELEAARCKAA